MAIGLWPGAAGGKWTMSKLNEISENRRIKKNEEIRTDDDDTSFRNDAFGDQIFIMSVDSYHIKSREQKYIFSQDIINIL